MKKIGVVGAGYWGKNLLRNFRELGCLAAICDKDARNPNLVSYDDVAIFSDYQDFLTSSKVDAVAISAPARLHFDMTRMALDDGFDVFVEKPIALTVKQAEEIIALADRNKRVLMVGHILQYHPAVLSLQSLVASGELGKIEYIYSNRLNIGKFRTEENILWSFAPHDISVVLSLIGRDPVNVIAAGGDYINKGVYDTTLTTLEFDTGIKGHIFVSWLHPFKEQKLVVVGSHAMAVFDDMVKDKLTLYPHKVEWKEGNIPVAHKADHKIIDIPKIEPLKEELKHFIECINSRRVPKTDGKEGLRVLKVLEMAEQSLARQRTTDSKDDFCENAGCYVHETAVVDEEVQPGNGTKIWHFSHIARGCEIGKKCIIGQNVYIGSEVKIGDHCKIQNNVSLYKGVILEDEVFCGPSCVFTNVYTPRAFIERKKEFRSTIVRKGATIGANATIVCGVTIGRYSMIGAGAVVKNDVPPHAVIAGVPAKQIGWCCKCGTTLIFTKNRTSCSYCGNTYAIKKNSLVIINEQ